MLNSVDSLLYLTMRQSQESLSGCLLLVIGASGVGKDSVLKAIQQRFCDHPKVHFLKRVITRPCNPDNEIHDTLTEAEFLESLKQGKFAVSWQANGNYYGLPRHSLSLIEGGTVVVANGSRGALNEIKGAYPKVKVVLISATAETIEQRLHRRTRDTDLQKAQRLQRNKKLDITSYKSMFVIDNDGPLLEAVESLSSYLNELITGD